MLSTIARASGAIALAAFAACTAQSTVATAGQSDDIVVRAQGQQIALRLHQTIRVVRPADFADWQVDYAADVLKALDAAQQVRSPGADGWRFEAIGRGETDIVVTPIVAPAPNGASPPRFTVTVRVS